MKTNMMAVAGALIILAACSKEKDSFQPPAERVNKTVSFSIFQARNYADPVFDGVMAELRLSVSSIHKQSGLTVTLWDTTIAFQPLRSFPPGHQPAWVTKTFAGMDDNQHTVAASYWITYRDGANRVSGEGRNEFVLPGTSVLTLPVRL